MSVISSGNTVTTAFVVNGDTTGNLVFSTGGANTVALTLANTQAATFANSVTITGTSTHAGNASFGNVTTTGSVGIGTSTPTYKLVVQDSANTYVGQQIYNTNAGSAAVSYLQIGNNTSGAAAQLGLNSSTNTTNFGGANALYLMNGVSAPLVFGTGNAEQMRIDQFGRLCLGTTTSFNNNSLFTIQFDKNAVNALIIRQTANDAGGGQPIIFVNTAGTAIGSVTSSGSGVAFNASSDYRLKENVQPITGALDAVKLLKPCNYNWKLDGSTGQGFIAHELQEICPQAVFGEKDSIDENGKPIHQGVDTSKLIALLTKAIQELNVKVDAQAAEIKSLKGN